MPSPARHADTVTTTNSVRRESRNQRRPGAGIYQQWTPTNIARASKNPTTAPKAALLPIAPMPAPKAAPTRGLPTNSTTIPRRWPCGPNAKYSQIAIFAIPSANVNANQARTIAIRLLALERLGVFGWPSIPSTYPIRGRELSGPRGAARPCLMALGRECDVLRILSFEPPGVETKVHHHQGWWPGPAGRPERQASIHHSNRGSLSTESTASD